MGEEVKLQKPNSVVEGFKSFCRFLYNPDDHTVFGRGGASWAKIILFYIVFYGFLAGFFSVCIHVMLMTLDDDVPTVTGRTNRPVLAISDTRLYTINFKNMDKWTTYKNASADMQEFYGKNVPNDTIVSDKPWFTWNEDSLGLCGGQNADWAINRPEEGVMKGCFFMGLNRMYGWEPALKVNESHHLSYNCAFDRGPAGTGNVEPIAITMKVQPEFEEQELETYYPWKSMAADGLQPLVAVYIEIDAKKAELTEDYKLETYVKCFPYIRTPNGTDNWTVEDSSAANFEIIYSNKLNTTKTIS